jgi:ribosomal protein S18 acetylase RimI-like enzyme
MKPYLDVREAEPDDLPILREMLYHAIFVERDQIPPPRDIVFQQPLSYYIDQWGQEDDLGVIIVDKRYNHSLGAAWLRILNKPFKGYGFIHENIPELSIAVNPLYRRNGYGTLMLSALIDRAAPRFSEISLSVSVNNPAISLYSRHGFEVHSQNGKSITMLLNLEKKAIL